VRVFFSLLYVGVLLLAVAAALPPWRISGAPLIVTVLAVVWAEAAFWGLAWEAASAVRLGGVDLPLRLRTLARLTASVPGAVVGMIGLRLLAPLFGLGIVAGAFALALFTLPYGFLLADQMLATLNPERMAAGLALALPPSVLVQLAGREGRLRRLELGLHVAGRSAGETAVWYLVAGVGEHGLGWAALHLGAATLASRLYYLFATGGDPPRARFLLAMLLLASVVVEAVALAVRRAAVAPPLRGRRGRA
jgi:hypothetical protein